MERVCNITRVKEFRILGYENMHNVTKILIFGLFVLNYIVTFSANTTIMLLVSTSRCLRSPMYFFLGHLSSNDILLSTTILPQMLHIILKGGHLMSLSRCFTQLYFFQLSTIIELLLLTVMSYDRYLAICNPLHYSSIMDLNLCVHLVLLSWISGLLLSLPHIFILSQMIFCGSSIINHFFCDLVPLLKISCSSKVASEVVVLVLASLTFCSFIFIIVSYGSIFLAILRISSSTGRQKAFSTCSSHLTVVCIYYGTLIFNYLVPSEEDYLSLQKLASILYTMVTPLLNPVIYSLRNKEVRGAVMKSLLKRMTRKV